MPLPACREWFVYQNSKHKFASGANFGDKCFELYPSYDVILFLHFIGVIGLEAQIKLHVVSEF